MATIFKKFLFKSFQTVWSKWYPKHLEVELGMKHVANCKTLAHRFDLLDMLPKSAIAAELGVESGLFSKEILERCKPQKLILVDTWPDATIFSECSKNTNLEVVEYQKMRSVKYLNSQSEDSLDWIYIDTDHTYHTTKLELQAAARVVKDDGFICGHDYTSINYSGLKRYGVVEAVNEFCVNHNYEFIYLTAETTRHISFALQKIQKLS